MTAPHASARPNFFKDPLFCLLLAVVVGNFLLGLESRFWSIAGGVLEILVPITGNADVTGLIAQAATVVLAAFLLAFRARTLMKRSGFQAVPTVIEGAATTSARRWAALAHLSALSGLVTMFLGAIMGPTVVLASSRTRPFAYQHAREAMFFNVFVFALIGLVAGVSVLGGNAMEAWSDLGPWLPWIALALILLWWMFLVVRAAIAAYAGRNYRYPVSSGILRWWAP